MAYTYVITEQYLGPIAKSIQNLNRKADKDVEIITSFVEYDKHMETLTKLNYMLEGGTWGSPICDVCYYGDLDKVEEESLYGLLEKARGEIQRKMKIFEQDQLTILKQK